MAELPEVAIEMALLERATAFAQAQSLPLAVPNVDFTPPAAKTGNTYGKYLRFTYMPAPSDASLIAFNSHVTHSGLVQIDAFMGAGAGEPALARIASAAIAYFPRGLQVAKDGFKVRIDRAAYRGPLIIQDAWAMVPVTVPWICFARPS